MISLYILPKTETPLHIQTQPFNPALLTTTNSSPSTRKESAIFQATKCRQQPAADIPPNITMTGTLTVLRAISYSPDAKTAPIFSILKIPLTGLQKYPIGNIQPVGQAVSIFPKVH